jgi:DNA (cytosine-5)-methyltransferase 1
MFTYGSLFSGIGGFDMGFDKAGYDCKWQVEWDADCQQTLQYHWPDVPKFMDIRDVVSDQLSPVDVITHGSPCQDLSVAGKRAGIRGEKSGMFFESVRLIKEMRNATAGQYPRISIWENVKGALTSNEGRDFKSVLDAMEDAGAVSQWWSVLDAQFFGVPQRRRRLFLVSVFDPAIARRSADSVLLVNSIPRRNEKENGYFTFYTSQGKYDRYTEGISTTLKTAGITCITHSTIPPRKLTPIEAERLMGYPDNHTLYRADGKTHSDTTRHKMCGNGIAAPVAQWVAEQVRDNLLSK